MSIKIGNASIDENGKLSGGKVGDQTGREICTLNWYNRPWNVYLECKDAKIAKKAASFMNQICLNNNYGYDQSQRITGYNAIVKNNNQVAGAKGEFDCSSLVSSCYKLAGLDISPSHTTSSLRKALLNTGKFVAYTDNKHIASDDLALIGSLYLSEGDHVVMALENGKKVNPYPEPTRSIKRGIAGEDVKYVQWELINYGIKEVVVNGKTQKLIIDGKCGPITEAAIKLYQKKNNLEVDGSCGPLTRASFKKNKK